MDRSPEREDWRREHSLLELGRAMRGEDHFGPDRHSLTLTTDGHDLVEEPFDARERHRLARERREAMEEMNPPAYTAEPQWPQDEQEDWQSAPLPVEADEAATWNGLVAPGNRPSRKRHLSWRLIATTTALGLLLGGAVAFSLPARYQATAELTLGSGNPGSGAVESQLRVLTSGIVLTKVVDGLNLASDPEFNGKNGNAGGLTGLLRTLLMRDGGNADEGHRQALAVERLSTALSVSRAADGGIAVTATTGNGEKSALIANAVADAFVQVYDQNRSGAATGSASGTQTGADTAAATAREHLADFAKASDRTDLVKDPARIAEILDLDKDRKDARARTEALNAKVSALRSMNVDSLGGGLPAEFETGAVQALRMQYLDIKRQADQAAVKLGPRNPERRAIEAQLAGARGRLTDELRRIVAAQQARLKQAVETEQALASRLARTGLSVQDIAALREIQQELASSEVDRQTMTGSISAAGSDATAKEGAGVVSRASPPTKPSGPPRLMMTLTGAALGLFAGLGLGAVRGREDDPEAPARSAAPALSEADTGLKKRWRRDAQPETRSDEWDDPFQPAEDVEASPHRPERLTHAPFSDDTLPLAPAIMDPTETNMHPVYPDQLYAQAPQQPQAQSRPRLQHWQQPAHAPAAPYAPVPYAAQAYPPPAYPPHPMMQPMPPYPVHGWPVAAGPAQPYPYPAQAYQPYAGPAHPVQQAPSAPDMWQRPAIDHDALDEIRASLHEFREALRDLADNRSRRRTL